MTPTILVTGANGQLGKEIAYLETEYRSFRFLLTDIDDLDISNTGELSAYLKNHNPDYIINCAGYTAVDRAEDDPASAMKLNATAVKNIIEAITPTTCKLIHISTDYVLNGNGNISLDEESVPDPKSAYALSKYKGEQYALESDSSIVIRTSWLYSSYGHNFVKTILRLSGEKESISVVNDQIGTPTYAADLAGTILKIISSIHKNPSFDYGGIYNFSNAGSCSWFEFACKIKEIKGLSLDIKAVSTEEYPLPAHRPPFSVLDKNKIQKIFSISIPSWESSLERCLGLLD